MKKIISIALIAMSGLAFGADATGAFYSDVLLSITANTNSIASATYTAAAGRVTYPVGLYQTVTSGTNTVVYKVTPAKGAGTYTLTESTAGVVATSNYDTIGIGDVTADVDPIILQPGDVLTVYGTGTPSANVTEYILKVKTVNQ
jgi:hypothetical protein